SIHVTGEGYEMSGEFVTEENAGHASHDALENILLYGMLCNEANLSVKKGKYQVDGDPTDGALLVAARKFGLPHTVDDHYRIVKQFPFDSVQKRMSVVVEDENKRRFLITKGAPEIVLPRCTSVSKHKQIHTLEKNAVLEEKMDQMAGDALRMIAVAIRPLQKNEALDRISLERELTFVGVLGLKDPPRKEVAESVLQCKKAGIKTVMITGDHKKTATAIAAEVGLLEEDSLIL